MPADKSAMTFTVELRSPHSESATPIRIMLCAAATDCDRPLREMIASAALSAVTSSQFGSLNGMLLDSGLARQNSSGAPLDSNCAVADRDLQEFLLNEGGGADTYDGDPVKMHAAYLRLAGRRLLNNGEFPAQDFQRQVHYIHLVV